MTLGNIERLATSGPQLSAEERALYERLWKREARASADLKRALKRSDAKKAASAERVLAKVKDERTKLLGPKVDLLWAPTRIIAKFKALWSGPGTSGYHVSECEMVLDFKDLNGPEYRTVRVLKDEGAPPVNARSAPDRMGLAWFAVTSHIREGKIVVLDEEMTS